MDVEKLPLKILHGKNIWCTRKHGDTSFRPHWHEYYEIIYYHNCSGYCVLNGEEYPITNDCFYFLTPKDVHSIHTVKEPQASSIVCSFTNEVIDDRLIKRASTVPRILHNPSETVKTLMKRLEIVYKSERKESHSRLMLEYILNAILIEILENGVEVESNQHTLNPAIEKGILYIMTDVTRNFTLAEIAEFCHLSPAYFSALFRQEMGKTLTQYINEARTEMAKHLLQETKKSVLDISLQCGYNTVTHFIKIFKANTGVTPSVYRSEHEIQ